MSAFDRMTMLDHLEELRRRLWTSLAAVALGAIIVYSFSGRVLAWLARPVGHLVFVQPFEAFMAHLHIAVMGGIVLALPVLVYELTEFVRPALELRHQRWLTAGACASVALFCAGMAIAYRLVIPLGLKFLLSFSSETVQPMLSVGSYVSTVGWLLIAFGLAFQLPIVVFVLALLGVVDAQKLARWRPYAIVGLLIVAAAVTPGPDVLSQIALAIPLWLLFESSIWLIRIAKHT